MEGHKKQCWSSPYKGRPPKFRWNVFKEPHHKIFNLLFRAWLFIPFNKIELKIEPTVEFQFSRNIFGITVPFVHEGTIRSAELATTEQRTLWNGPDLWCDMTVTVCLWWVGQEEWESLLWNKGRWYEQRRWRDRGPSRRVVIRRSRDRRNAEIEDRYHWSWIVVAAMHPKHSNISFYA